VQLNEKHTDLKRLTYTCELADIYGFNKNTSKPEEFYSAFRVNKQAINTFNTSSKEAHRRKRRIMAKAFSEACLQSYELFISRRVLHFMQKLNSGTIQGQKASRPFNMAYEFNCLMLDIMGGLCFGESFGFVDGKGDEVMAQAHKRTFRIYMVSKISAVQALSHAMLCYRPF
jgi:cytochrome P450